MALSAYFVEDPITRIVSITLDLAANTLIAVGTVLVSVAADAARPIFYRTLTRSDDEGDIAAWETASIPSVGAPAADVDALTGVFNHTTNCMIGGRQAGVNGKNIIVAGGCANIVYVNTPTQGLYHHYGTLHYSYDGKTWAAASIPVSMPESVRGFAPFEPTYHAAVVYLAYDPETQTFYADLFRMIVLLQDGVPPTYAPDAGSYRDLLASNDGINWRVEASERSFFADAGMGEHLPYFISPFLDRIPGIPNNGFTEIINPAGDKLSYSACPVMESTEGGQILPTAPFMFNGEPVDVPYGSRLGTGYYQSLSGRSGARPANGGDIMSSIGYANGEFVIAGSLMRGDDESIYFPEDPTNRTIYVYTSSDGKTWTKRLQTDEPMDLFNGSCAGSCGAAVISTNPAEPEP